MATLMSVATTFLYYFTVIGVILAVLGWVRARFPNVGLVGMLLLSMLLSPFVGTLVRYLPWWVLIVTGPIGAWQTLMWVRRLLGLRPQGHVHRPAGRPPAFRAGQGVLQRALGALRGLFGGRQPAGRRVPPARPARPRPVRPRPVRPRPVRPVRPQGAGRGGPWPDPM